MKKITLALFCSLVLFSAPLHAEVKSIVDWDGGNNPYKPGKDTIAGTDNPANLKTTCSSSCPKPYSITTTSCPEGQILVHCPARGCGYYNLCRNKKNKDEEAPNDIWDINKNEINLPELLDEIDTYQYNQEQEQQ
ncbi:MAG: hypothetical protein J6L86_02000 [Alphaproteobacteria bacterium]|nr:hypothetical protein [Alphaproteobacteria bacterium]MBQ8631132.1 hypothetical protein [Alphaproteobacteria bacterium]